jgi:SnoaL-like domain
MTTLDVGKELVQLCKTGKNAEAIDKFYAKDIVSVEACAQPGGSAQTKGKDAVKAKTTWWLENHELHSQEVRGPFPNGDKFSVLFKVDVTFKPEKKRFTMEEIALYTVKNGLVVHEEFFYSRE